MFYELRQVPDLFKKVLSSEIHNLSELSQNFNCYTKSQYYSEVLLSYLHGNLDKLLLLTKIENKITSSDLNTKEENDADKKVLQELASARLNLRKKVKLEESISQLKNCLGLKTFLIGEIKYVIALLYEALLDSPKSIEYYNRAARIFEKQDIPVRVLLCKANSLACESRINTNSILTPQYEYIVQKALELECFTVAGVNLNNISYEYQLAGAYRAALHYCQESILILEKFNYRSINYYNSLLQRCYLLIKLDRLHEAELDFEKAILSPFIENKKALSILAKELGISGFDKFNDLQSSSSWEIKVEELKRSPIKLTDLEDKIISHLIAEKLTLSDLSQKVFGNNEDLHSIENRVKVAFSKIRKKRPGLIVFSNGFYCVSLNLYPEYKVTNYFSKVK